MKINRKEFCEHMNYFIQLNKYKLEDLDLSEFGLKLTKKEIQEWINSYFNKNNILIDLLKTFSDKNKEGYFI